ncbi:hypothetical protein BGX31_003462 [Mortierella sp. GBA43]|nr:hypothetical protein BGX31_003462 [Mortierella sp. GBA43]
MTVACLSFVVLSVMIPISSFTVDAAPAKHTPAPANLVKGMSMAYSPSDTSDRLPLQLQIEAQVAGKQQLAYLPTGGPSLDFYYLNYRPAYRAGESTIDFWMLTPKGSKAPKTGSLELYDEFGRIRLAVLVPEGTEIPQALANKNEPFLWKSWPVPKTLKADFDFSEKFRVVLRTSDSKTAQAVAEANVNVNANGINKTVKKRLDDLFGLLANPNKNQQGSATSSRVVAQDRQFRIKGLTASPGGQPHPAKLHVNSVAPATVSGAKSGTPFVPSSGGSLNTSSGNSNANSNSIGHDAPLPSNSNDKDNVAN